MLCQRPVLSLAIRVPWYRSYELTDGKGFQRRAVLGHGLTYLVIVQNKPASFSSPSILILASLVKVEYFAGCCPQLRVDEAFPAPLQNAALPAGSPAVPNEESRGFKVPPGSGNRIAFWKHEHHPI